MSNFEVIGQRKSPAADEGVVVRVKCKECGQEDWRRPELMNKCEFCGK